MSYDSIVLADSPTAYWPLSEARGAATVADATGHGHSGTVGSAVVLGTASLIAGDTATAATFPGANDATGNIALADSTAFASTGPYTVEAWVTLARIPTSNARIFSAGVGGVSGLAFGVIGTYANLILTAYGVADVVSSVILPTGTAKHLVCVADPTNGHALFYVNGTLADTQALSSLIADSSTVRLGNNASVNEAGWPGVIEKVAVYAGVALPAWRVLAHYQAGIALSQPGTVTASDAASATITVTEAL